MASTKGSSTWTRNCSTELEWFHIGEWAASFGGRLFCWCARNGYFLYMMETSEGLGALWVCFYARCSCCYRLIYLKGQVASIQFLEVKKRRKCRGLGCGIGPGWLGGGGFFGGVGGEFKKNALARRCKDKLGPRSSSRCIVNDQSTKEKGEGGYPWRIQATGELRAFHGEIERSGVSQTETVAQ